MFDVAAVSIQQRFLFHPVVHGRHLCVSSPLPSLFLCQKTIVLMPRFTLFFSHSRSRKLQTHVTPAPTSYTALIMFVVWPFALLYFTLHTFFQFLRKHFNWKKHNSKAHYYLNCLSLFTCTRNSPHTQAHGHAHAHTHTHTLEGDSSGGFWFCIKAALFYDVCEPLARGVAPVCVCVCVCLCVLAWEELAG